MRVIVVAGQKGGSGKTNLVRSLAVAAGQDVALIDRDPQGSLTSWWNRRKAPTPPLVTVRGSLADTLDAIREAGMKLVFIDTAPSVSSGLVEILASADMILLPVRPTPDDLDAVGPTLRLVTESRRKFIFVLSQAKAHTRLSIEALPVLAASGHVCPTVIYDRIAYPTAAIDGLGVTELGPGPATSEIESVLAYVLTQTRTEA